MLKPDLVDRISAGYAAFLQPACTPDSVITPFAPPNPLNPSGNAPLMPDPPENWPMRYCRSITPGATYFFTVVTYRRQAIPCEPDALALLREAFATIKQRHPFRINAVVILPDHLHCLWTLPSDDSDYSTRWMLIKSYFTRRCAASLKIERSLALRHKREQMIWQPRYWEHQIRDERDFERHCDYIHYNPVDSTHL